MVRFLGFLVGLGFVAAVAWSLLWGVVAYVGSPPEQTAEARLHEEPHNVAYSFNGPFGRYDLQQLQRGFQVFKEVCSACHSLSHVAFRDLRQIGYSEAEVRAIADQWQIQVPSINPDTGEAATRKAIPADHFPSPYANETAGRAANNNAMPPDLSLMAKAREGGPAYIESLLTGYQNPPAGYQVPPNLHYKPYFATLNIAMPPPITADGQVTYADGTNPTVGQMAKDVSAFLMWTAEPKLENRHRTGIAVLIFLIIATVLAYMAYRNVWGYSSRKVRAIGPLDPENMAKRDAASRKAGMTE
jgi:ubiquinol-cytochrome c reductase cytochrome c1 subunit